jgi:hypothetical protein
LASRPPLFKTTLRAGASTLTTELRNSSAPSTFP